MREAKQQRRQVVLVRDRLFIDGEQYIPPEDRPVNTDIFLSSTATFKYKYPAPPQTNWTRIFSVSRIFYFSVTETDTVTSGPF